jgi:hydroxyquinol 1,2-dioxygenase
MDGTVGELMQRTDISRYRPAHIHFLVEAPGYHRIITHLFQRGDQYLDVDVVYGVKQQLIVDFNKKPAGMAPTGERLDTAFYEVNYNFVLQALAQTMAA